MFSISCRVSFLLLAISPLLLAACTSDQPSSSAPRSVSILDEWPRVNIENPQAQPALPARTTIRFDGTGTTDAVWEPLSGVTGLEVRDGLLVGHTTTEPTAILFTLPAPLGAGDELWSVEFSLRVTAGERAALLPLLPAGGPPIQGLLAGPMAAWPIASPLSPGAEMTRYKVELRHVLTLEAPMATREFSRFLLRPTAAADAEFAIESIRFVFREEHLATIPSGPGWHGLGEVYRETLVSRAPEVLTLKTELPERPWLDLAVGSTLTERPTFRVSVEDRETVETVAELVLEGSDHWQAHRLDLGRWAGRSVTLRLQAVAEQPGALAFWGGTTIRSSVDTSDRKKPQAVILFLADTLRKDHLEAWGQPRNTAPHLARLAAEGVRFDDTIAQSTWTKASVPAILTSLYPSTAGIVNLNDRVSAAETTLAEIFRAANYATFATSSIPFTGQLTNLHQGFEVVYEYGALGTNDGAFHSKTSTAWVDAYLAWLEVHRDVPTFALVHVMDPHSPFEPPTPYDLLWTNAENAERFAAQVEEVTPHIKHPLLRRLMMPSREELQAAGVDEESFLAHEKALYDGSIRHMDDNLGRLLNRVEELGLAESTLLSIVSDHGEEFLEHGRHWHGLTTYGEVANVPMLLWGQGVPRGVTVEETVQTIDLLPTLAHLTGLEIPPRAQGRSLVPLFQESEQESSPGGGPRTRPAFTERRLARIHKPGSYTIFSMIDDGWKLVWNLEAPAGVPTYELFDHRNDPLNQRDLANSRPEQVEKLAVALARWKEQAESQRLDGDDLQDQLSAEELERLRSLGYID